MSRALRRHHNKRLKQRALKILSRQWWGSHFVEDTIGKWFNNLSKCSCSCCGNPRRKYGRVTLAEVKMNLTEAEWKKLLP